MLKGVEAKNTHTVRPFQIYHRPAEVGPRLFYLISPVDRNHSPPRPPAPGLRPEWGAHVCDSQYPFISLTSAPLIDAIMIRLIHHNVPTVKHVNKTLSVCVHILNRMRNHGRVSKGRGVSRCRLATKVRLFVVACGGAAMARHGAGGCGGSAATKGRHYDGRVEDEVSGGQRSVRA